MKRLAMSLLVTTILTGAHVPSGWAHQNTDASKEPATPQPAAQPTAQAASNTRWATCVVEVSRETGLPSLDELSTFIDNTAGQLAPTMAGMPRELLPAFFTMQTETHGSQMQLTLTVDLPAGTANVRPAAREYLDRIVRDLMAYLDGNRKTTIDKRVKSLRTNVAEAEQSCQDTNAQVRALENKLREQSGRLDVSPQNLKNAITQLDEEHMRLEIEQAAKLARRTALTKALADSKQEIEQRVKDDPVLAELEKVVEAKAEVLKRKRQMVEQGAMSKDELSEAEAELSQVRAQLLDRRQQAAEQAGAGIISSWNHELLSLSVDENEMLARLEQVSARLQKMRTLLDSLHQLEDLQRQCEDSEEMVRDAQHRMRDSLERLREAAEQTDTSIVHSKSAKESPGKEEKE